MSVRRESILLKCVWPRIFRFYSLLLFAHGPRRTPQASMCFGEKKSTMAKIKRKNYVKRFGKKQMSCSGDEEEDGGGGWAPPGA